MRKTEVFPEYHKQFLGRRILLDTSSAILLYKAGIVETFFDCFQVVLPQAVFNELTCNGYTGAEEFFEYQKECRITVVDAPSGILSTIPLTGGERELVLLYKSGWGDYIVVDDRKAAVHCRDTGIPFVNALLVPKILLHAGYISDACCKHTTAMLKRYGRYAPWVISFAKKCSADDLKGYF